MISFSRSPLEFSQVPGARRCASRVERRRCTMEALAGKEGGADGGVDNVGLPGLPGTSPKSPRGSFGHPARDCCDEETSGRGNAAGSPIELAVDTSAHRVSRAGRCRGRGSARFADLDQAAVTKLHAEEKDAFAINKRDLEDGFVAVRSTLGVLRDHGGADTAHETAGESPGGIGLLEVTESAIAKVKGSAVASATTGATVGESQGIIGFRESQIPSLSSSGCLSAHACATLSSAPASAASSRVCPVSSSAAVSAAVVHACSTPTHNSCSDTVSNSLLVERCRKVRLSSTVGSRSVVQTVDMSPAPAAGTYRRSAEKSA